MATLQIIWTTCIITGIFTNMKPFGGSKIKRQRTIQAKRPFKQLQPTNLVHFLSAGVSDYIQVHAGTWWLQFCRKHRSETTRTFFTKYFDVVCVLFFTSQPTEDCCNSAGICRSLALSLIIMFPAVLKGTRFTKSSTGKVFQIEKVLWTVRVGVKHGQKWFETLLKA